MKAVDFALNVEQGLQHTLKVQKVLSFKDRDRQVRSETIEDVGVDAWLNRREQRAVLSPLRLTRKEES